MKSEIIFIVDEFDKNGMFRTIEDQYRDVCKGPSNGWYDIDKKLWSELVGNRIKFQTYSTIDTFDPNKRYFYFCPIYIHGLDWFKFPMQFDSHQYRRMIENNVAIILADDCEVLPFLKWESLKDILELMCDRKYYHEAKIYFFSAGKLIPNNQSFLDYYFHNSYKFLYSPLMIKRMQNELSKNNDYLEVSKEYHNSKKEKQFLNLNLQARFHRKTLGHALRANNLMDQGFSSYGHQEFNQYSIDHLDCSNKTFYESLKNDMKEKIGHMFVDNIDPNDNNRTSLTIPKDLMKRSCYDLVSETAITYDRPGTFDQIIISEKVMKSLYYGRPFMINGGPYVLNHLKELGFKTFDWLFDESYDQTESLLDRQEIIINNIKKYHNQSDKIMDLVNQNKDVLDYNHSHFVNFDLEDYYVNMLKSL